MSFQQNPTQQQRATLTNGNPVFTVVIALVIPTLTIVGLFVLIGLGKLAADVGVPIIAGLAGVHGGAVVANSSSK